MMIRQTYLCIIFLFSFFQTNNLQAETSILSHDVSQLDSEKSVEGHVAKGYVIKTIPTEPGQAIGVIELSKFYPLHSQDKQNIPRAARDVRQILEKFKREGVAGIVLDLRGNGGGLLSEAVEIAGLFIKSGGIVQIKNAAGELEIKSDPDPSIVYSGPIAVMVDHASAAASEIVAATIQDYKRGVVIGERTFGDGTIQTLIFLGRFLRQQKKDIGQLRLTIAVFFRPEGSSIQQRGIEPDVVLPTDSDSFQRERSLSNSLPWSRLDPIQTKDYGFKMAPQVLIQHSKRRKIDNVFRLASEFNQLLESIDNAKSVSLNESQRIADKRYLDQKIAKLLHRLKDQEGAREVKILDEVGKDETLEKAVAVLLSMLREAALRETVTILTDCIKAGCYQD